MRQSLAVGVVWMSTLGLLEGSEDAPLALRILLTTAPDIQGHAREALIGETTAIWRRAGVELVWQPSASSPQTPALRVLVVRRPALQRDGVWALGQLIAGARGLTGQTRSDSTAFVSIDGARQVLEATTAVHREPTRLVERRLGIILGRAAAHEIGHFLLATHTHSSYGLMRAVIHAEDFADLRDGGFFLDRRAASWIHALKATPTIGRRNIAGFSYEIQ